MGRVQHQLVAARRSVFAPFAALRALEAPGGAGADRARGPYARSYTGRTSCCTHPHAHEPLVRRVSTRFTKHEIYQDEFYLFIYLKDTPTDGTTTTAIQLLRGGLRAHQRGFEGSRGTSLVGEEPSQLYPTFLSDPRGFSQIQGHRVHTNYSCGLSRHG